MFDLVAIKNKILSATFSHNTTIAIDGRCGAGKTTLANELATVFDCNIFPLDFFYLPPKKRKMHIAGEANADIQRFEIEVLSRIYGERPFAYNRYCCKTDKFIEVEVLQPKKINIIEGTYCLDEAILGHFDFKIFITAQLQTRKQRLLERGENLKEYLKQWMPLEEKFFEVQHIADKADLILET